MYLGHIIGIASLPISILLFCNEFAITNIQSIFGINIVILAALCLIAIQVGDVITSHVTGNYIILSWIVCAISCIPSIAYIISMFVTLPETIVATLPIIIASFMFIEGIQGFYIGGD